MEKIKKYFKKDNFAEYVGIELVEVKLGYAVAKLTINRNHLNGLGTVQGGALFTLADLAFAAAANSHGTVAVAINCSMNFMKAVSQGTLFAEAKEDARNPKIGSYTVHITDQDKNVIAIFQGLAYRKKDTLPV